MAIWKSPFNFPVAFSAALKNNVIHTQCDAFNILITGIPHSTSDSLDTYDDSPVTGFVRGARPIPKKWRLHFISLTAKERLRRIESLGISNTTFAVNALACLLESEHIIIDAPTKKKLLNLAYGDDPYLFLNEVFYEAIKRGNEGHIKITDDILLDIFSFRNCIPGGQNSEKHMDKTQVDESAPTDSTSNTGRKLTTELFTNVTFQETKETDKIKSTPFSEHSIGGHGICIDSNGGDYFILDNYKDDDYLSSAPSEYIANYLYYITLSCPVKETGGKDRRKNYLLVRHERYLAGNELWSVPCCSYTIQTDGGLNRPKTVRMIREYYKKHMGKLLADVAANTNQLMFHLSILSGYTIEEGNTFIEYKKSPTQPDRWKCYQVHEYFIKDIDPSDLINLVDPHCIHNYHFFPLSDWEDSDGDIPWIKSAGGKLCFPGGFLPENVARNIIDQHRLKYYINQVPAECMYTSAAGYLMRIEVINYSYAYSNACSNTNLHSSGQLDGGQDFERIIHNVYEQVLLSLGINQFIIDKSTLTAMIPLKQSKENLKTVIGIIDNMCNTLYATGSLQKVVPSFFCVIHYCNPLLFGKKYGPQQPEPVFFGEDADFLHAVAHSILADLDHGELSLDLRDENHEVNISFMGKIRSLLDEPLTFDIRKYPGILLVLDNAPLICNQYHLACDYETINGETVSILHKWIK